MPTWLNMTMNTGLIRVILGIFAVLGLLLTSWRVYFRLRIGRFWWEDAWATAAFFTGLVWLIAELIDSDNDRTREIIAAWIYTLSFNLLKVMVRMSILFSIIRLINRGSAVLNCTRYCATFIFSCGLTLIVIKIWGCASTTRWHHEAIANGTSYCILAMWFAVIETIFDLISVTILVALPLRILWKVKLPPRQRRMILSIFASSTMLVFASLFHMIGRLSSNFFLMTVGLNLEVVLSLFICNLLVVVTYTYRYLLPRETSPAGDTLPTFEGADPDDDFTRPTRCSSSQTLQDISLTTIGIESYTTSCWTRNDTSSDHTCSSPLPSSTHQV